MGIKRILICLFLFASCQDIEEAKKPNDLIPKDKMVDILTDLTLLNSAKNYNKRILESTGLKPDEYLYAKHNIDSLQLAQSTQYYAQNFDVYKNINTRVQNRLKKMKVQLEKERDEEQRIKDSLREERMKKDSLLTEEEINQRRDSMLLIPKKMYEEKEMDL